MRLVIFLLRIWKAEGVIGAGEEGGLQERDELSDVLCEIKMGF